MSTIINASTSSGLVQTADTSGTLVLQSNGTTQLTVDSTGTYGQLKSKTVQASTSGTAVDFTSIPSWVKRITVLFKSVSASSTGDIQVQIGTGGVATTSGYLGTIALGATYTALSAGFVLDQNAAATGVLHGIVTLALVDASTNTWAATMVGGRSDIATARYGGGSIVLSGTLDIVRISVSTGTFDAGSINILYEG